MDSKGYAIWESDPATRPFLGLKPSTPEALRAAAARRTALLAHPELITAELELRRAALRPHPFYSRFSRPLYSAILAVLLLTAFLSLGHATGASFPLGAGAMGLVAASSLLRDRAYRLRNLCIERARAGACPDCGYDLRAVEQTAPDDGLGAGPPHCPECGAFWPLVPPALDGRP